MNLKILGRSLIDNCPFLYEGHVCSAYVLLLVSLVMSDIGNQHTDVCYCLQRIVPLSISSLVKIISHLCIQP